MTKQHNVATTTQTQTQEETVRPQDYLRDTSDQLVSAAIHKLSRDGLDVDEIEALSWKEVMEASFKASPTMWQDVCDRGRKEVDFMYSYVPRVVRSMVRQRDGYIYSVEVADPRKADISLWDATYAERCIEAIARRVCEDRGMSWLEDVIDYDYDFETHQQVDMKLSDGTSISVVYVGEGDAETR